MVAGFNKQSGEPAITLTLEPEKRSGGLPGALDHIKWHASTTHQASTKVVGFDVEPGRELSFHAWVSGQVYGAKSHPFGDAVPDPEGDIRLAAAMNVMDPVSGQVFDFLLTNEQIYAVYERLPRFRAQPGDSASFTAAIPVARRSPHDRHHLAIAYAPAQTLACWLIDGTEVHRVTQVGHRPEHRHLLLDYRGQDALVTPHRLNGGLALVTLLDGASAGGPELVRLSSAEDFYFHPGKGAPQDQAFVDEESRPESRLFGQGAALSVSRFVVGSTPVTT